MKVVRLVRAESCWSIKLKSVGHSVVSLSLSLSLSGEKVEMEGQPSLVSQPALRREREASRYHFLAACFAIQTQIKSSFSQQVIIARNRNVNQVNLRYKRPE